MQSTDEELQSNYLLSVVGTMNMVLADGGLSLSWTRTCCFGHLIVKKPDNEDFCGHFANGQIAKKAGNGLVSEEITEST